MKAPSTSWGPSVLILAVCQALTIAAHFVAFAAAPKIGPVGWVLAAIAICAIPAAGLAASRSRSWVSTASLPRVGSRLWVTFIVGFNLLGLLAASLISSSLSDSGQPGLAALSLACIGFTVVGIVSWCRQIGTHTG